MKPLSYPMYSCVYFVGGQLK